MKKLLSALRTASLTFLLTVNIYLVISLVLVSVGAVGWVVVRAGLVDMEQITSMTTIFVVLFSTCLLLGVAMVATVRLLILRPMHQMVDAMGRLAQGDFEARLPTGGMFVPAEVREFAQSYNVAAEALGSTELMRRDFVRNFSHEFRTPITSIAGFADFLAADDDGSDPERAEYLGVISTEAHRLATLSEDVLLLSRVDAAAGLDAAEPVDVAEQLRCAALEVERRWHKQGIAVEVGSPADRDACVVQGAPALLSQVWINLLDNAAKFSPEGGAVEVGICPDAQKGVLAVTVRDHGCGMDEATAARVFEQFFQGDTSHKTQGNGLGLAIARRIVELHRGSIDVASAPGEGSAFTVALPRG